MSGHLCDELDTFLLGDLDRRAAQEFERHAEACPSCRAAVSAQRRIDHILKRERSPAPGALRDAVAESARQQAARRVLRRSVTAAAASVAIVAAAVFGWSAREPVGKGEERTAEARDSRRTAPEVRADPPAPAATFESEDMIAEFLDSPSPEVTVFRLYPTLSAQRRQLAAARVPIFNLNGAE